MSTCLASLTREILIHGPAVNKWFNSSPEKFQSTSGPFGQLRFTSLKCYSQRFSTYKYHTSHQTWSTMTSSFPGRDSYKPITSIVLLNKYQRTRELTNHFLTDTRCPFPSLPFPSIGHFSFLSFLSSSSTCSSVLIGVNPQPQVIVLSYVKDSFFNSWRAL